MFAKYNSGCKKNTSATKTNTNAFFCYAYNWFLLFFFFIDSRRFIKFLTVTTKVYSHGTFWWFYFICFMYYK